MANRKTFFWYELMTPDIAAAQRFYGAVIGWNMQPFDNSPNPYIVFNAGERGVGGITSPVPEIVQGNERALWIGYIYVGNVDEAARSLRANGGTIRKEPQDVGDVGRIAAAADPQGAPFMLMTPNGPDQPAAPMEPGFVGWNELRTSNWQQAFDFYAGQFGWTKGEGMDMGAMGIYQIFNVEGEMGGAMMNRADPAAAPIWHFYFNVGDIDVAARTVRDQGGNVQGEPIEVPGGSWAVDCTDPQGATFGLVGNRAS